MRKFITFLPLFFLFFVCVSGCKKQSSEASVERSTYAPPVRNANEDLFLVYLLRQQYLRLPAVSATDSQQLAWINSTKIQADAAQKLVQNHGLDPALNALFVDSSEFAGAYHNFVDALWRIKQDSDQRAKSDAWNSLGSGLDTGSKTDDLAHSLGSDKDSHGWGVIGTIVGGLADYSARSDQRTAAEKAAIDAEGRKLVEMWAQTSGRLQSIDSQLGRTYGWSTDEMGFDLSGNLSLDQSASLMPRNPFAQAQAATDVRGTESAEELVRRAKRCLRAADMVPADGAYQAFRVDFTRQAAEMAVTAAATEAGTRGYSNGLTPTSGYAEYLARNYLSMSGSAKGQAYVLLGRSLGLSGRYQEALEINAQALQADSSVLLDPLLALHQAALFSLTEDEDSCVEWLKKAYQLGFNRVDVVRADEDFASLKRDRPEIYAELTTPRLEMPHMIWALMFRDDASVRNLSPFNISNVTVQAVIHKGSQTYPFTMQCALIKADEICRVDNVVDVPGGSMDYLEATFNSDQSLH